MPGEGNGIAPEPGSADSVVAEAPPEHPEPELELVRAEHVPRSVAPTLRFTGRATDDSGRRVYTIALTATIVIEPGKRRYDEAERPRLIELFGEPERWSATTGSFRWAEAETLVPAFEGSGEFQLTVPCTYDLELGSAKYFDAIEGGEIPLRFHFAGTVFYEGQDGRIQMNRIHWDRSERFSMPTSVWKEMIAEHYPFRGWVPLHTETVSRLAERKATTGAPTFDAAVAELLDGVEPEAGG